MIKAVIFDMDGVISDTQKFHAEAESRLLKKHGITMKPEEITRRFAGVSDDEMFETIFSERNKPIPPIEELLTDKWSAMYDLAKNVKPIAGSTDLIAELASRGYGIAVASSSPHRFIDYVLTNLKVDQYFTVRVSAEDVKNGKPAPDIFLLAAEKLNHKATECIVIEDANSGITAAKAAGMPAIAYGLDNNSADYKVNSHTESLTCIVKAGNLQ